MNHVLRCIAILAVASCNAFASYEPTSLLELVGLSEKIVVGVIVTVDEKTVDVKIEDPIFGPGSPGETIVVKRFCDWACAKRWAKYEAGQRVLLFLSTDKKRTGAPYRILGAGDEGESRVVNGEVEPNFDFGSSTVETRVATKITIPLGPFSTAMRDFRAAFRLTPAANPWRKDGEFMVFVGFDRIERASPQPAVNGFQKRNPPGMVSKETPFEDRSPYHKFLAKEVKSELRKIEDRKE